MPYGKKERTNKMSKEQAVREIDVVALIPNAPEEDDLKVIEFPTEDTAEQLEDIELTTEDTEGELKGFELSDDEVDLLFPEEWGEGYFNGCDLAFPFEAFPPSNLLDPFGILDLPNDKEDEEFKKMIDKELKQTWWSKLVYKLCNTDWKAVDKKINTACVCFGWILGRILRVIIIILSCIFTSLFLICFISELAPGIREHIPSFFMIIDGLLNWFDKTIWRVMAIPFK